MSPAGNAQGGETRARVIAFYLPQFHPIPENDQWWGRGFTEWTNVTKATPLFRTHYQPHLPADLGFYDLRLPEARCAQAELANAHSLEGFCYWHYWFNGKRLLERPFGEVLESGTPRFPFCLAWANETWSRRWLGEEKDILQKQNYSPEDDVVHARWLANVFADDRCIKVNGRPLFLIYRPLDLPDPKRTTDTLREQSVRHALPEPFLLGINAHCSHLDCRTVGFDGTINFEPQLGVLPDFLEDGPKLAKLASNLKFGVLSSRLKIYDYSEARRLMLARTKDFPIYPSIFVGWDNTPRRGRNSIVIINSTPQAFGAGLAEMVRSAAAKPYDDRLIFVNAWNEWAEGNHLEPDLKNGLTFLEAVKRVNLVRNALLSDDVPARGRRRL
jgi:lipopolysaccharide biosynthesis protein